MYQSIPATQTRQAESHLEQCLGRLWRVGLLTLVIGLPVFIGGAPTLANAGATVVAAHMQPGQIQSVRPFGNCPGSMQPC